LFFETGWHELLRPVGRPKFESNVPSLLPFVVVVYAGDSASAGEFRFNVCHYNGTQNKNQKIFNTLKSIHFLFESTKAKWGSYWVGGRPMTLVWLEVCMVGKQRKELELELVVS
jgi:hypothetical protein